MSIVTSEAYSFNDPNPVFSYGEGLVSFGLYNRSAINGFGAVTRGFLWQLYDIYIDTQFYAPITTNWVDIAGVSITTTWAAASGASIATTWTPTRFGLYGEYTP